jgi:hypothetical protein
MKRSRCAIILSCLLATLTWGCSQSALTSGVPTSQADVVSQPASSPGIIYVGVDTNPNKILVFRLADSGDVQPRRIITGSGTMLNGAQGLAMGAHHMVYVANAGSSDVLGFARDAHGDAAPVVSISCGGLDSPGALVFDGNGELSVLNQLGVPSISIFSPGASGCVSNFAQITGDQTRLKGASAVSVFNDHLAVLNVNNYITFYPKDVTGNVSPIRKISGLQTGLSQVGGAADRMTVDPSGVLYVANVASITEYVFTANGDAPPIHTISGPSTGLDDPVSVGVDGAGFLYVMNASLSHHHPSITVYAPGADGDAAPVRTIIGMHTHLSGGGGIAVDG